MAQQLYIFQALRQQMLWPSIHAAVWKSLPESQKALPSVADDDENFAGPEAKPIKKKKTKVISK